MSLASVQEDDGLLRIVEEDKGFILLSPANKDIPIWKNGKTLYITAHRILNLFVNPKYRNQQTASELIIKSIIFLRQLYPHIRWITVDDMSDNSTSLRHNVYRKFGFRTCYPSKVEHNMLVLSGPEKQLNISPFGLFFRYYLKKYNTQYKTQYKINKTLRQQEVVPF
jgi:hypothetical protein